jgi:hypothetical protein
MTRCSPFALLALLAASACLPEYSFRQQEGGAPFSTPMSTIEAGTADVAPDSASDAGPATSIACHSGEDAEVLCEVGKQACCSTFVTPAKDFCVDLPDTDRRCTFPGSKRALVECDEPSDCPSGTVCCMFDVNPVEVTYSGIRCVAPEQCVPPHYVECGLKNESSDAHCPLGQLCTQASGDGYYAFCN